MRCHKTGPAKGKPIRHLRLRDYLSLSDLSLSNPFSDLSPVLSALKVGMYRLGWVITEELVTAISRVMSANPEMSRTRDLNFLGYARKPRGAYLQSTSRPRFPGVPLLSSKMTLIQYKVIKKES